MSLSIAPTPWQTDQASLIAIREQVFIREQNVSAADEWDGKDDSATHFLVRSAAGETIGCARVLTEVHTGKTCFHIGRVALLKEWRKRGIGQQLMRAAIAWCQGENASLAIFLHAQVESMGFYQRLGFTVKGDIFMDAGIPHIEMWYKLLQ